MNLVSRKETVNTNGYANLDKEKTMSSQPILNKERGRAGIGRGGISSWKFTQFVATPKLSALKTLTNNIILSE